MLQYIAAMPSTEQNKKYMKHQLQKFLDGQPPLDFHYNQCTNERQLDREASILSGEQGRRAMGFGLA